MVVFRETFNCRIAIQMIPVLNLDVAEHVSAVVEFVSWPGETEECLCNNAPLSFCYAGVKSQRLPPKAPPSYCKDLSSCILNIFVVDFFSASHRDRTTDAVSVMQLLHADQVWWKTMPSDKVMTERTLSGVRKNAMVPGTSGMANREVITTDSSRVQIRPKPARVPVTRRFVSEEKAHEQEASRTRFTSLLLTDRVELATVETCIYTASALYVGEGAPGAKVKISFLAETPEGLIGIVGSAEVAVKPPGEGFHVFEIVCSPAPVLGHSTNFGIPNT
ncbi:hypothetical protein EDC04DRAFT_2606160 [Pisolithus marmoratus]|nr:hypothetical protein EDC04DRAFT_2606160 [Pisolithus marmoratus]